MEMINFTAWKAQGKVLTADDIVIDNDKLIIGKKVNSLRDGSEYQAMILGVDELITLLSNELGITPKADPFLIYTGLISQANNAAAPTLTTLQNTLPGAVSTQRLGAGDYLLSVNGAFPDSSKIHSSIYSDGSTLVGTLLPIFTSGTVVGYIMIRYYDANSLNIKVMDDSFAPIDLFDLIGAEKIGLPDIKLFA